MLWFKFAIQKMKNFIEETCGRRLGEVTMNFLSKLFHPLSPIIICRLRIFVKRSGTTRNLRICDFRINHKKIADWRFAE
jgi:hypothetical protein